MSKEQVHAKFKLFVGPVATDGSVRAVADQVVAFAKDARVAPKSIGVEYLESQKTLVLSLGYRDDEPTYGIKITTLPLGKLGTLSGSDVERLEASMTAATAKAEAIICHELFVTEAGDCHMVIMSRA